MLLAIDTSAGTSVAVVDLDGGILAERGSDDPRGHAERVGELIEAALAAAGVRARDLSGVAAGMGPGPFTGLRVGIAAARVFAAGIRRPVVPVISHDAVAFGRHEPVVVATDARRREFFVSAYDGTDDQGLPIRASEPAVVPVAALETGARTLLQPAVVSAGALGMVAELQYAHRRPFAADEAVYLRSPDVTPSAGPKRVS
jgi:tRNA threonylcarbamoyl adenosine modification protein YeaZ